MAKSLKRLQKVIYAIDRLNSFMKWPSAFLLIILTCLVIFEVIMRYVFSHPTMFSGEVSQMLQVGLAMLGAGYVLRNQGHVHVEIVFDRLTYKVRSYVGFVFSLLGVLYCGMLVWLAWLLLDASMTMVDRTLDLAVPLWPMKGIFLIGVLLFGCQFLVNSIRYFEASRTIKNESSPVVD